MFLNSDQFIWDTQQGYTPGTKAPKRLCSENTSANGGTAELALLESTPRDVQCSDNSLWPSTESRRVF